MHRQPHTRWRTRRRSRTHTPLLASFFLNGYAYVKRFVAHIASHDTVMRTYSRAIAGIVALALTLQALNPMVFAQGSELTVQYKEPTYIQYGNGYFRRVKPDEKLEVIETRTPIYWIDNNYAYSFYYLDRIAPAGCKLWARDPIDLAWDKQKMREGFPRVLYYGFGGPGFDRSMWPKYDWDENPLTDDQFYALTQLLLHKISGGTSSTAVMWRDLMSSWFYERILNKEKGVYGKMLKAPMPDDIHGYGFQPTGKRDEMFLKDPHMAYIPARGFIHLDLHTLTYWQQQQNAGKSLKGITYRIYSDPSCTKRAYAFGTKTPIADMVSNEQGVLESGKLKGNTTYYIKQLTANDNADADKTVYDIRVGSSDKKGVEIVANEGAQTLHPQTGGGSAGTGDSQGGKNGSGSQDEAQRGTLQLTLSSHAPQLSANNANYSFETAKHAIYSDKDCKQKVADVTFDAAGKTQNVQLKKGSYYIKELEQARGYARDTKVHTVAVAAQKTTTLALEKHPQYYTASTIAQLIDKELAGLPAKTKQGEQAEPTSQGKARFKDAQICVELYANEKDARSGSTTGGAAGSGSAAAGTAAAGAAAKPQRRWILSSNTKGAVELKQQAKVAGDDFILSSQKTIQLPLGYLKLTQVKASYGYNATSETKYIPLAAQTSIDDKLALQPVTFPLQVVRGGLEFSCVDKTSGTTQAQGDASFSSVQYSIRSDNTHPVVVNNKIYNEHECCLTLEAKRTVRSDGSSEYVVATAKDALPCGDYVIERNVRANGYVNTTYKRSFTIDEHGSVQKIKEDDPRAQLSVIKGGLQVALVDAETRAAHPLGAAVLKDAEFTIYNNSASAIYFKDKKYEPNSPITTIVTNKDGIAKTTQEALPYGTYTVRLTKAPRGYTLDKQAQDWKFNVSVREKKMYEAEKPLELTAIRRDIAIPVRDAVSHKPLAGKLYSITSKTTGEVHVVATNSQGEINTSSDTFPHDKKTNELDSVLKDGVKNKTAYTCCGCWFNGTRDGKTLPNNAQGALPYDTYTICELLPKDYTGANGSGNTTGAEGTGGTEGTAGSKNPKNKPFSCEVTIGDEENKKPYDELGGHNTLPDPEPEHTSEPGTTPGGTSGTTPGTTSEGTPGGSTPEGSTPTPGAEQPGSEDPKNKQPDTGGSGSDTGEGTGTGAGTGSGTEGGTKPNGSGSESGTKPNGNSEESTDPKSGNETKPNAGGADNTTTPNHESAGGAGKTELSTKPDGSKPGSTKPNGSKQHTDQKKPDTGNTTPGKKHAQEPGTTKPHTTKTNTQEDPTNANDVAGTQGPNANGQNALGPNAQGSPAEQDKKDVSHESTDGDAREDSKNAADSNANSNGRSDASDVNGKKHSGARGKRGQKETPDGDSASDEETRTQDESNERDNEDKQDNYVRMPQTSDTISGAIVTILTGAAALCTGVGVFMKRKRTQRTRRYRRYHG